MSSSKFDQNKGENQVANSDHLFDMRYKKLNPAQRKAVDTIEGPLLVVAGPGSGKTEILSMRVAQILRETQVMPSNILCLTFTDSAAQNMRERLCRLMGDRAYQVSIHTFHNFCTDIIRHHGEFFYHGATFSPADPVTQIALLESIFNDMSHDDPLRSYHPEEGFVYIRPVLSAISHIKKAGLRPVELAQLIEDNAAGFSSIKEFLIPILEKTLGKNSVREIKTAVEDFIKKTADKVTKRRKAAGMNLEDKSSLFVTFHSIEEAVALSLTEAIGKVEQSGKNEPLSKWKQKWLAKDEKGERIFKDEGNIDKMRSFAKVYEKYQAEMYRRGYFDFDDMILDVITALEREPKLRYAIQEQFQYLLVDEFQDTNNAQMRILSLLTSAIEHEGKPNIMVVGDDDQAIYKFQGAELSNILDFKHRFTDVELVTLIENYRSTQDILDIAMGIIRKGEKRLENLIPNLSKQLVAKGVLEPGAIKYHIFETALHEYKYVADAIKKLIEEEKIRPEDIAVIGRKHEHLELLVPYMKLAGVPIKYEREQSVFAEPHIHELITLARYVSSTVSAFQYESPRDDLLPEILSFKFWNVPRVDIWKVSLRAKRESKTWLEVMIDYENPLIKQIAEFLIELGADAQSTPLELMLDRIIGAHIALASDDERDDIQIEGQIRVSDKDVAANDGDSNSKKFTSPFRDFYFSKERYSHSRAEYLAFLSSLRVFINALRAFNGFEDQGSTNAGISSTGDNGEKKSSAASGYSILRLIDLVKFVDVYEKNNLKLNDESPFVTARSAVELMSAHKSKGLEFKIVFILSCQDEVWAGRGGGMKLSFPINMPIEPAGDNEDDQLRLFYVAITRAKERLYMTAHEVKESGKQASQLRFLVGGIEPEAIPVNVAAGESLLEATSLTFRLAPFLDTEEALLKSIVEKYKLSVTHLNNFLNIPKGGPAFFFEQNLLRFPQSKSPSGSYGSAMHSALEFVLQELKQNSKLPDTEVIQQRFEIMLRKEKLHPKDFTMYLKRGQDALVAFIKSKGKDFKPTDIAELDFGREDIMIKDGVAYDDGSLVEAFVTGKIDKVSLGEDNLICVHDYKTGRAFESFDDPKADEEVKVHLYKNQLLFYKLLIDQSAYAQQILFSKLGGKVNCGVIDFVEPVGKEKKIQSIMTTLEDADAGRLRKLILAVYKRIKNLDFEIPTEIDQKYKAGEYKKDIDAILDFEEYLLENA